MASPPDRSLSPTDFTCHRAPPALCRRPEPPPTVSVRLGYSPDWPEGSHSCRDLVSLTGPRSLLCFCVSPYPLMVAALMWDFLVPLIIIKMINCTSGAVLCGIYTVFILSTIEVGTPAPCLHCKGDHASNLCSQGPGGAARDTLSQGARTLLHLFAGIKKLFSNLR